MAVSDRQRKVDAGENPDLDENDPRRIRLMTVLEAIERYWDSHITSLAPKSQEAFVSFVGMRLRRTPKIATRRGANKTTAYTDFGEMFGDRPFSSIKPLDIERFQQPFTSLHSYMVDCQISLEQIAQVVDRLGKDKTLLLFDHTDILRKCATYV